MISLPRHVKNLVRRSTIVAPSKPLQGFSINVPSGIVRPEKSSWNTNSRTNHTAQVVTGLDLVPLYHAYGSDVNLQHPDYADERTRLQSFKHWCGIIPATELADAGLYMVARDTVRCYSCHVVIQGWKKGDRPIDMHCMCSGDCDFVKKYMQRQSEIGDIHTRMRIASYNVAAAGRRNHGPLHSEKPVIKERIKENSYSCTKPLRTIAQDSKSSEVTDHQTRDQTPAVVYPASQQSVLTHGHLPKGLAKGSTTKWTSDDIIDAPLSEKMIISDRRLSEEECCINYMRDNKPRIVPVICKVCQDNKVDCVLLPCGDAKTCTSCATTLFNSGQPCYFCNQTVATVHPIYL